MSCDRCQADCQVTWRIDSMIGLPLIRQAANDDAARACELLAPPSNVKAL